MKAPKTINTQAVDAVTVTGASVLGVAPAMAMASLLQTLANSQAMVALNAVHAQQQAFIAHQAATTRAVAMLLALLNEP